MTGYSKSSHSVYDIKYHIAWVTKYRYKVLRDKVALRLRDLIRQSCQSKSTERSSPFNFLMESLWTQELLPIPQRQPKPASPVV
jgi:putative transposase